MKANNICGFGSMAEYISDKLMKYEKDEKSLETLFKYMFCEGENVFAELTDGYRIKKITYGEIKNRILSLAPTLSEMLCEIDADSLIGLYMSNSPEWIVMLWTILASGHRPLLMNSRLPDGVLEDILVKHKVGAVISDGKIFSVKTVLASDISPIDGAKPTSRPFGSEIIFMSSGTTEDVKLCAYNGENLYYQVCDSLNIVKACPSIVDHYEGELKHLALLPFYHVFGFMAVYLWFGFFSRIFVFPKDMNPDTVRNTVKKHKVTHIFAVPMVWEAVHKATVVKIKARGDDVYAKFEKAIHLSNDKGRLGDILAHHLLSDVRDGLFGESIRFLISGGSHINPDTLYFYNGIGYHMANGYGMTEIGITSVERSLNKKILNSASIGAPFGCTEYSLNSDGVLMVRGKTRAHRIIRGNEEGVTSYDEWFCTGDLATAEDGRYLIKGRVDDLIVDESGENLNPTIAEMSLKVDGVDKLCIFADAENHPLLLVSVPGQFSPEVLCGIHDSLLRLMDEQKLGGVIKKIIFTHEKLVPGGEIKISRTKIAKRYNAGQIRTFDPRNAIKHIESILTDLEGEIRLCFASALDRDAESIGIKDDFFTDLGGNSMDYFVLLGKLKAELGIDVLQNEAGKLHTVKDFCDRVRLDAEQRSTKSE